MLMWLRRTNHKTRVNKMLISQQFEKKNIKKEKKTSERGDDY